MRGLWRLMWLETKIFVREPMGVVGTVGIPVFIFIVLARMVGDVGEARERMPAFVSRDLPILGAMFITATTVLSLVTIVAIYREGGILKRLRATPLRPQTILTAHVLVKLLFTTITVGLMFLAGRRFYPWDADVPLVSFALALLFSTATIISFGFVLASIVPTARFAQPIATLVIYPMLGVSGLFVPVEAWPPAVQTVARLVPFTYAVSLLRGIWQGEGWTAHLNDVGVLVGMAVVFTAVSAAIFRWE